MDTEEPTPEEGTRKPLRSFYLTFGQQYRREEHPSGHSVHPDGYVEILAHTEGAAREKAFATFGPHWFTVYSIVPGLDYFPRGCLFTLQDIELPMFIPKRFFLKVLSIEDFTEMFTKTLLYTQILTDEVGHPVIAWREHVTWECHHGDMTTLALNHPFYIFELKASAPGKGEQWKKYYYREKCITKNSNLEDGLTEEDKGRLGLS